MTLQRTPAILLVALTLFVSNLKHRVEASLPHEITLAGKSYTLSAELLTESPNGDSNAYELEEFYSDWQRRTRINYRIDGPASRYLSRAGSIFASAEDEQQVFMVDRNRFTLKPCMRIERHLVAQALHLDQLVDLFDKEEVSEVLGAARLLLWLARHSREFEEQADRNVFGAKVAGQFKVTVSYQRAASLPMGLPSRVLIERADGFTMAVRYKQVALLAEANRLVLGPDSQRQNTGQRIAGANEILFDVFALDRNAWCSLESTSAGEQKTANAIQSALTRPAFERRFSFKARIESNKLGRPAKSVSVMYEPTLDTLRVDQVFEQRAAQTLISFQHDRVYHVLRRLGADESKQGNEILDYVVRMDDDTVSCVVTKNSLAKSLVDSYKNPNTLGAMLLGAARSAIYLGLAQVRGIEAHAFEAHDQQMPVWLEQPLVYQKQGESPKLRTGSPDDPYPLVVTTVFYFARTDDEQNESRDRILGNRLLHLEIFRKTKLDTARGSLNISIYDFSWSLRNEAPNGERSEHFLSLADHCLAPSSGDNHYARINFVLQAAAAANQTNCASDWLRAPAKRNLALMRAVHEQFQVPPTLVFDVESRHAQDSDGGTQLVATMLAAERYEAPVELAYLGRAAKALGQYDRVTVGGFQECFLLAAHRHAPGNLFGYRALTTRCYIAPPGRGAGAFEQMFERRASGTLEVYAVSHRPDRKLVHDDYLTKLDEMSVRIEKSHRLVLEDPESPNRKSFFSLASWQVEHLNEKVAYELDEQHHLYDINKFPRFGLVASDPQNKLVAPRVVFEPTGGNEVTRHTTSMTFEQCQEACLVDLECRAYSTCLVPRGQLECILTSVDFTVSTVVLELMAQPEEPRRKSADVFPVQLTDTQVIHVKRHANCELHNKLCKHLFRDAGKKVAVSLQNRALHPVAHSEQCAEICFRSTLEIMRNETQRLRSINKENLMRDPRALAEFTGGHCTAYLYLDKQQVANDNLTITPGQIGKARINIDGATRGYCLLDEGRSELAAPKLQQVVELRKFELDFTVFYEKNYGVSLKDAQRSPLEEEAFRKVIYARELLPGYVERVGEFLDRGDNTGKVVRVMAGQSSRDCARMCFAQLAPTWPACRSFDMIEVTHRATALRRSLCVFNTMTMNQLQAVGRTDMILQDNQQDWVQARESDAIQVWHFEPRQGLVANSLDETYQVVRGEIESLSGQSLKLASPLRVSSLSLFCITVVVVAFGLIVGTRVSATSEIFALIGLGGAKRRRRREDKEVLVDENGHSLPRLTFEDAVGAEQVAPQTGVADENKDL